MKNLRVVLLVLVAVVADECVQVCRSIDGRANDAWCAEIKCLEVFKSFCQWQCDDDPPKPPVDCECHSIDIRATDEWCRGVGCIFQDFCSNDCSSPAPTTTPVPTAMPTLEPSATPTIPSPTSMPMPVPSQSPSTASPPTAKPQQEAPPVTDFARHGYVENWKTWTKNDLDNLTSIFYAFLTLDPTPNPDSPRAVQWDGTAIYETMTRANVIDVMDEPENSWLYKWQSTKIKDLQTYCVENGINFVWAIGGWSDLTLTMSDAQVPLFVDQCIQLLLLGGANGIDLDFEHLSAHDGAVLDQQRHVVARIICELKTKLVAFGLADMLIYYTPRYNAFFESGKYGSKILRTDGEGIDTFQWLRENCAYGDDAVDYINLMAYDISALEGFTSAVEPAFTVTQYDAIVDSLLDFGIDRNKIIMGYEPGIQAYTGVWAGAEADAISQAHLFENRGIKGLMWWAMNEDRSDGYGSTVGKNAVAQAANAATFTP